MGSRPSMTRSALRAKTRWLLAGTAAGVACVMALLLYSAGRSYVIDQAERRIRDVMLESRALHRYAQRDMHPALYKLKDEGRVPPDFYSPELLSSSYIARNLYGQYNELREAAGLPEVRYKLAAINPRNPLNEADARERSLIEMFDADRTKKEHREIIEVDGRKYLYYATPFLTVEERCLKCHGSPEAAPRELREYYNWSGGYGRQVGEVFALESIRSPLEAEFHVTQVLLGGLLALAAVFAALFFVNTRLRTLVGTHTAALRESEAQKQALLDGSPDVIMLVDERMRVLWANKAALDLYPAAIGQTCHEGYAGKAAPCEGCPCHKATTTGEIEMGVIHHKAIPGLDGESDWEVVGVPVKDDDGKVVSVIEISRNITQRVRAEAEKLNLESQLRQAQKMEAVGQLAGGVAHDFNNILTAIIGNLELAQDIVEEHLPSQTPLRSCLEEVEQASERAAALTRQLLVFSRRDVAQLDVLDLNQMLRGMEKMLGRLITESVSLEVSCAPDLAPIRADAGRLEQVIMNLVINARDAMPNGGVVRLETANVELDESYVDAHAEAHIGPHVELAVGDTGCGMDPQTVERIFEPFFTTKPVGQGSGLGLATAYGIVKQLGGHIVVDSRPEQGTTFRVFLPTTSAPSRQDEDPVDDSTTPVGDETILVCEDDGTVRRLTECLLRDAGYTVFAAENGEQALRVSAEHPAPIQLLVTDVIMPGMNGRALATALRTTRPDLKTLYISGYTSDVIARHGVLDEQVEFLHKPFTRHALLKRVREVLDRAVGACV